MAMGTRWAANLVSIFLLTRVRIFSDGLGQRVKYKMDRFRVLNRITQLDTHGGTSRSTWKLSLL